MIRSFVNNIFNFYIVVSFINPYPPGGQNTPPPWYVLFYNFEVTRPNFLDDDDVFVVRLTDERRLALFPTGAIVRDPQHRESSTHHQQGLNLRRT